MAHTDTSLESLKASLEAIDQSHVLTYFDDLNPQQQAALLNQIAALDLDHIPQWIKDYVFSAPEHSSHASQIQPAPYYSQCTSADPDWDVAAAREQGETLIREGKIAAFTVAGGQGTRLGYDGPKGTFPATPVHRKSLFAIMAEGVGATSSRYGISIPWYIMTSPLNHQETIDFFEKHQHFGLDPKSITFFSQGVLPSFDKDTGKLLLASRHEIATNPDGHGGSLKALWNSGAIEDMTARGVQHISYIQIDNPLAKVIDPIFIGLHAGAPNSSAEMSSKMVAKRDTSERVGVFCTINGKTQVIEYSDLPEELAEALNPDGGIRYNAGSIAIHTIGVDFVRSLNASGAFSLEFHRAVKKVPYVDVTTGKAISPEQPNAIKLETFVFDALKQCESSIVYEVERTEEFAPIKNAAGTDSPQTSVALQTQRAATWLERAGITIPRHADGTPNCTIELSPLTALDPEALKAKKDTLPQEIEPGQSITL